MCGCVDDRREKFRTRCGVEWRRSIGAGTSRRIDSFGLQMIHRRSVYEPYRFDRLRERLSRNERSKIRKQKRGQQLVFVCPVRIRLREIPFFAPLLSSFPPPLPFSSSSRRPRCKNRHSRFAISLFSYLRYAATLLYGIIS